MAITATSRSEIVPQEIEFDMVELSPSTNIFAVDDPCLIRMKFQTAFLKSLRKAFFNVLRLLKTAAVDQTIISVPAKR